MIALPTGNESIGQRVTRKFRKDPAAMSVKEELIQEDSGQGMKEEFLAFGYEKASLDRGSA